MALNDAALVLAANAVDGAITHMQLHSGAPGAAGTSNVVSGVSRVAVSGSVDSNGDITWTAGPFTGGTPGATASHISYWSASTSGTFYGSAALSGDTTLNSEGEFTEVVVTESSTAS